jgi:hypothetical protein
MLHHSVVINWSCFMFLDRQPEDVSLGALDYPVVSIFSRDTDTDTFSTIPLSRRGSTVRRGSSISTNNLPKQRDQHTRVNVKERARRKVKTHLLSIFSEHVWI